MSSGVTGFLVRSIHSTLYSGFEPMSTLYRLYKTALAAGTKSTGTVKVIWLHFLKWTTGAQTGTDHCGDCCWMSIEGDEVVGEGDGEGEDEVWAGMATLYVQLVVGGTT